MAINDISLSAGMRNNLISLQQTNTYLNRTQERLSSGKKVNSALDNPTNYFSAQGYMNRASDLTGRKDGMSEAIQAVKAANSGITGITALIDNAKGIAQAARSADAAGRVSLQTQYDEVMTQITNLANDAGYKGKNLLTGVDPLSNNLTVEFNENGNSALTVKGFDARSDALNIDTSKLDTDTNIDLTVTALTAATTTLRTESARLAANLNIITTRQDFTTNMINTLTQGADNLTLADMNEEGANMLMLQTRQALGTTALSLSSQAAQSVLRLF
jgi:flagellin